MYLSRVEINPYRRESMRALGSPQIMHAAVMASFGSFGDSYKGRILWRVDKVGSVTYVLVQSDVKPDFHHIVDQYGRPDAGYEWDSLGYDGFLSSIENGQYWRFRLRANPVHSVAVEGKRGKVCAHVTADQQISWLKSKSLKCGFSVEPDGGDSTAEIIQREVKKFNRDGKSITISMTTYEGILEVTDSSLLVDSIINGIGRAKAYGCGMMTLMRP